MARRRRSKAAAGGPGAPALAGFRRRLRWPLALVAVAVLTLAVGGSLLLTNPGGGDDAKTAAIVDQLSLTQPNSGFALLASETLQRAGYAVDYFPGEQVTVDFYRDLPPRDYDVILMRVHSARLLRDDAVTEDVSLFTSEPYEEARAGGGALRRVAYYEGGESYLGIPPAFVESSFRGDFGGATVVMMGCDGLRSRAMAQAFIKRGAGAFISWDQPVSAPHTDAATERLLQLLLLEGLPVQEAVARTMAELGPDPAYGAQLRYLTEEG